MCLSKQTFSSSSLWHSMSLVITSVTLLGLLLTFIYPPLHKQKQSPSLPLTMRLALILAVHPLGPNLRFGTTRPISTGDCHPPGNRNRGYERPWTSSLSTDIVKLLYRGGAQTVRALLGFVIPACTGICAISFGDTVAFAGTCRLQLFTTGGCSSLGISGSQGLTWIFKRAPFGFRLQVLAWRLSWRILG